MITYPRGQMVVVVPFCVDRTEDNGQAWVGEIIKWDHRFRGQDWWVVRTEDGKDHVICETIIIP